MMSRLRLIQGVRSEIHIVDVADFVPWRLRARVPTGQAKDDGALIHIEQTWAQALEQRDSATLDCILADEFEDAGPDGKLTNRATTLAKASEHPAVHHDLTDLQAHVQGDFGYIRGLGHGQERSRAKSWSGCASPMCMCTAKGAGSVLPDMNRC